MPINSLLPRDLVFFLDKESVRTINSRYECTSTLVLFHLIPGCVRNLVVLRVFDEVGIVFLGGL